ncbi:MAG: hypothetical protein CMQ20_08460 [Gammaproteobacteria bacterium]|jgi:8-oxo-dGTP pyrophosphatase MutT (NUDIX family)|nr:hypothetical protein [Gammaproteobacteria bacterium]|tara:strand:- start:493 stop:921 length:429 start_codon:yes stop_codon:yes gene_type:complete
MNSSPGAWMLIYCKPKQTFLFGKRGKRMRKPNLWNLFGGHIDAGETFEEGVVRELKEEAGISPADHIGNLPGGEAFVQMGEVSGIREMRYFLMVTNEEISPTLDNEHKAYGWYHFDDLPDRVNRPTEVAISIGLFMKAMNHV